jgi:hypothetical protein
MSFVVAAYNAALERAKQAEAQAEAERQRAERAEKALLLMARAFAGGTLRAPAPGEAESMVQAFLEDADAYRAESCPAKEEGPHD